MKCILSLSCHDYKCVVIEVEFLCPKRTKDGVRVGWGCVCVRELYSEEFLKLVHWFDALYLQMTVCACYFQWNIVC